MRSETSPPVAADFLAWTFAQPLGLAVLIIALGALVFRRVVTHKEMQERLADAAARLAEEQKRTERLQETVDTLSAGLNNATDALRKFADEEKVSASLIHGIDQIRTQRGDRR